MNTAESIIVFIIGSLTLLVFVFFIILILFEYRKRQIRHITEKLELKHKYENEVLQTQLKVQEQSFKYISEEIHDNIAQMLSLVKLKLYKTAKDAPDNIKAGIENSNDMLGKTMNDLRTLSHVMNGSLVSKLSLRESIEKELSYIRDVKDMQASLAVSGIPFELVPEKKLMIFRIVQEAINNAIKHSKATVLDINLDYNSDIFIIKIADNGTGFDMELLKTSKGLGLHNIQVRAKMLGKIDVVSIPGKGTTITLNIKRDDG